MDNIEMIIEGRPRDLGGFSVRRILPYATHRMVGPFIFFDHMGPAEFAPGTGLEVRPHPHISLATVTYLFEGKIRHRDSLGSDQLIEPGAINWMTAGRGIVHSERSPEDLFRAGGRMNGIQLWVALPEEHEDAAPSFVHHPADTLPEFAIEGVPVKLLLGQTFHHTSPVKVHSDLFYLETKIPAGQSFDLPVLPLQECAFYVESGEVRCAEKIAGPYTMVIAKRGKSLRVEALKASRILWLGGSPVGERFIFWNFVSSSKQKLEEAKLAWSQGPKANSRFPFVPGDEMDFIPLPEEPGRETKNPKGTIL